MTDRVYSLILSIRHYLQELPIQSLQFWCLYLLKSTKVPLTFME